MLGRTAGQKDEQVKPVRQPVVLIADAHEHYRGGLVRAIVMHPQLSLGAVTDDGLAALALIASQVPDVALLDVRLPHLDGFAISQRLQIREPPLRTRVVLLTAVQGEVQQARARKVGAASCLSKEAPRSDICRALLAAVGGASAAHDTDPGKSAA
jgi:two-component system, NarL family, nitrate/nitrite response regulator NarL